MTLRQIEGVLRPPWPGVAHALVPWCAGLIAARGWQVRLGGEFAAFRHQATIEVPHGLTSDADLASTLHEAGHLADARVRPRKAIEDWEPLDRHISIESECVAWLSATALAAHRWTSAMQAELEHCLGSYRDAYVAPYSMQRRLIVDTIAYTAARLRTRSVVSLRPGGGVPPVDVPDTIRSLVTEAEEAVCPR